MAPKCQWTCKSCGNNKVAVVLDALPVEIVYCIENLAGTKLCYVCSECTSIPKREFFGMPKTVSLLDSGYSRMYNPLDVFTVENGNIKCIVEDGKLLSLCSGHAIPTESKYIGFVNSIRATNTVKRPRRNTIFCKDIANHYAGACKSECVLCKDPNMLDEDINRALEAHVTPIKDTLCEAVNTDLVAEIERVPTKEEILEAATPEYFPDSHDDVQMYLNQVEDALQEAPKKKRKYAVKSSISSFFD